VPFGLKDFQEIGPVRGFTPYTNADGTAAKSIWGAKPYPSRMDSIWACNDDVIAHVVVLWGDDGSTRFRLGSATVPGGAGVGGAPAYDVLTNALPSSQTGLVNDPFTDYWLSVDVAVALTKTLTICTFGGTF